MIEIKNFTGEYRKENFELSQAINGLPSWIKKVLLPIEIYDHPRDVYGVEELEEMKRSNPHFNPDISSGGYVSRNRKIIIYSTALKQEIRVQSADPMKMSILGLVIHELGHYLWEERISSLTEWNQARRKDGKEKKILSNKFDFVGEYGFYDRRTAEEDFAASFRYMILYKEIFRKQFVNRYKFINMLFLKFK